ncbi:hypothetical protein N9A45_01220 [bacterium]|nr:hypothetical protein [bacterium]
MSINRKNNNPVPGLEHHHLRRFAGGLNHQGQVDFSVVFDKSFASADMLYSIVDVEPFSLSTNVTLDGPETEIEIARFRNDRHRALTFYDEIRVGVGVRSPCLPEHEIGRVYYYFEVNATYDLYHSYNNTLEKDNKKEWTSDGWTSTASLISYPPFNLSQSLKVDATPCDGTKFETSLDILNTSQFTYWDIDTLSYKTNKTFIGHEEFATPRCHRRDEGNICVVLARTRLTFGQCPRPVRFYIEQSVSHIARMSRKIFNTEHRPDNFDVDRRLPVPDHLDMRYDMCESRVCQYEGECVSFEHENDGLKEDGGIFIRQFDRRTPTYMETVCTFEVIGFLDDIWSPHIYFRHWAGFNYTYVES